ncbi:hypothetical protein ONS95_007134 [Cadophora gregata]|uniref:uncharacterized protein n=1 Tax=Cadophora gregata TaxID=51156 RepID=UPI0026DD28BF|nr:uncharacterized protein ONS95_007134 [Cadophora gregata]KAK0100683.1 hypothetical protein ONS95_007134 [Cadophora gregata]KAK0117319.1 hypothetical protein ONS96_013152 [Cadophora gregata f. sp. sojae]
MAPNNLKWLQPSKDGLSHGISFGMPWARGVHRSGQHFAITGDAGHSYSLDSRETAFWPDGSLKWTAHSVAGDVGYSDSYTVEASSEPQGDVMSVNNNKITTTSGLELELSQPGSAFLFEKLAFEGGIVSTGATIIASIDNQHYTTKTKSVIVENATFSRIVIKVSGATISKSGEEHLPFDVRLYIHQHSSTLKIIHSFIHDLEASQPLTSLGLKFSVPLKGSEMYNRHIRLGTSNSSLISEEMLGLSGLRYGPTTQNRIDQTDGKPVTLKAEEWVKFKTGADKHSALGFVPTWDAYTLSQLSSDGFTVKKRTKEECAWVKVTGGGRADGTAYVGTASEGGLAVGMSNFWERYPTQLDLSGLTKDVGEMTVWLYSPLAEPLDTRPFHDGLGMDTYPKQLAGLDVTYEDHEPGFSTANGIARTNSLFLKPYTATPSNQDLAAFSSLVRDPPRLVPEAGHMHSTGVFHGSWSPSHEISNSSPNEGEKDIGSNLSTLFSFYANQISQQRWYGFFDHGDIQHTYDPHRHAWRYDVGGFAWDNSELSTDLWLWLYFLHTSRADVFKIAEAMTQHTFEVDIYHSGRFKGFGTRHGVQHWSDSSKQLRISSVLFRRIYYYLTGDERIGSIISSLSTSEAALLTLDAHRKVQAKDTHALPPGFAMANIGLDCGPLMSAWLTAWERRSEGWEKCKSLLVKLLAGITALPHGIGSNAMLLNPSTGEVRPAPPPTPDHAISHLSMLFGFPEIVGEVLDYAAQDADCRDVVQDFKENTWLPYCRAYNAGPETQLKEFGFVFDVGLDDSWRQSHSTLTAFVAVEEKSEEIARKAWEEFGSDGYGRDHDWTIEKTGDGGGEEAKWITTNEAARYGVSALVNLPKIREFL